MFDFRQILHAAAVEFVMPNFKAVVKSEGYGKLSDELKLRLIQEVAEEDAFVGMTERLRF